MMKLEWNVSALSCNFKPKGRLFHIMGPDYVMLCLKISLYGLGVINECSDDDPSVRMFS